MPADLGLESRLWRRFERPAGIDDPAVLLFSESNTRFLVEVPPARQAEFEKLFSDLPLTPLGKVTAAQRLIVTDSTHGTLIDAALADLRRAWKAPLAWD